jgi:hypothetical protein
MKILFKKNIIFISVLCFFSALFIAALHHHDKSLFRFNNCTLCKISSSVSIAAKKANTDTNFVLPPAHLLQLSNLPDISETIIDNVSITPFSTALYSVSNKAPPSQS